MAGNDRDHHHRHHHHHHHQHQHHRPHRIKVPPRAAAPTAPTTFVTTPTTSQAYRVFPFSSSTPTASATPSKHRLSSSLSSKPSNNGKSSLSFLLLLLFSLRSLYSLLPFLRSSPSFSLFPFSFLVCLLSFLLTYFFSVFTNSFSSSKSPFHQRQSQRIFSLSSISQSEHRTLLARSILLAVVFLLRFQALRYCGTAAMILADLTGNAAARFVAEGRNGNFAGRNGFKVRGFVALFLGLFLLSVSWDRIECFPFSAKSVNKFGFFKFPKENCLRIWPMLLPFLSGFLGCYERVSMNWGTIRHLGRKRVRLISLFFTTVMLFFPAVFSLFMFESEVDNVSVASLAWLLANTVVFGVLLAENCSDEKLASSNDTRREFLVTFVCTLVLELFYFPELSLWGLLLCGLLLYFAVRELDPLSSNYLELGEESSDSFSALVMKPIRHILSERKSRKIALFLMINTGYMIVEFVAGFMSNSLGLISDACHMLFDCAALGIGLYASYISRLPVNNQFNYGRGRFEVLSGYVNAVFLVLVGSLIVLESLERILDPQEISTNSLLTVSIGGLVVNVVGLIFFHEEHHNAHGGSGSCSHSHSHSHSRHHQLSYDDVGHDDHKGCGKHEKHIGVSHESHEKLCYHHDENPGHSHNSNHSSTGSCKDDNHFGSNKGHDDHQHDHHGHAHQHKSPNHSHQHDHSCQHDQLQSNKQHQHHHCDHSGHGEQHGNHGHSHVNLHDHHDHASQHECHNHHCYAHSFEAHKIAESQLQVEESDTDHHHHHHHIDHNMEGIFLHVLADTMGSVGVVISTLLIKYKGWLVADPACSIFISVLIVSSVIPLLRNSAEILLQRIPRAHEVDLTRAVIEIRKMRGVCGIQNLNVWSFTNTDVVGTLHLCVTNETDKAFTKTQVSDMLRKAGIKDLTLQIESVR